MSLGSLVQSSREAPRTLSRAQIAPEEEWGALRRASKSPRRGGEEEQFQPSNFARAGERSERSSSRIGKGKRKCLVVFVLTLAFRRQERRIRGKSRP